MGGPIPSRGETTSTAAMQTKSRNVFQAHLRTSHMLQRRKGLLTLAALKKVDFLILKSAGKHVYSQLYACAGTTFCHFRKIVFRIKAS